MPQKRHFANLDGVRFIASFLVLFHHIEQIKYALELPNIYSWPVVQHAGRLGVGLFFVLSGFLITYLLVQERHNYGNVAARKFYLRRIFRIWPIYFLLVLSSYFLLPHLPVAGFLGTGDSLGEHYWERLFFLAIVLPNYAFVLYELPYWCAQAWSIGVEEQFYYLWPWLFKYPGKRLLILAVFLVVSFALLAVGIYFLHVPGEVQMAKVITFFGQFRIHIMALGGLAALAVYHDRRQLLDFLFRRDMQLAVYALGLALFFSGVHFSGFMEGYAVFFTFFILNVSSNPRSVIRLEFRWLSYLGKISYGLYLYHVVVTVVVINLLLRYWPDAGSGSFQVVLYLAAVALSVLVSALSYAYLEKPLLRYKDRRFGR